MNIQSAVSLQKLSLSTEKFKKDFSPIEVTKQFGSYLDEALQKVEAQQAAAEQLTQAFMAGDMTDVHNLLIESEKARLGLELTVQIRNKVIEAYQEIMRMQI
jgi:flagellar hook-basal body complex protein FliE